MEYIQKYNRMKKSAWRSMIVFILCGAYLIAALTLGRGFGKIDMMIVVAVKVVSFIVFAVCILWRIRDVNTNPNHIP